MLWNSQGHFFDANNWFLTPPRICQYTVEDTGSLSNKPGSCRGIVELSPISINGKLLSHPP